MKGFGGRRAVILRVVAGALALPVAFAAGTPSAQSSTNPFEFFAPAVSVSPKDLRALDKGESIARVLPGQGHEVAVFTAMSVNVSGSRLVAWMRHIAELKKSEHVLSIARFSAPPRIEDLQDLSLDDSDLVAIRSCKPGDCGLKLAASEITELQGAMTDTPTDWKVGVQSAFRALVLKRAQAYLASGHAALGPYVDHGGKPVSLEATFSAIVRHSGYLTRELPALADYLGHYPRTPMPDAESFLYWSKEQIGGKAQITMTHVAILPSGDRALPEVIVAGKQVFTTHYLNGSLGLTVILRGPTESSHYLAYLNRSEADVLGGFFGGLVRIIVEHRLKGEAPDILRALRQRLESGEPGGD